jgi:aquaporin Z
VNASAPVRASKTGHAAPVTMFPGGGFKHALKTHWPEYLMEGAELAMFMISACFFTVLMFHPQSPVVGLVPNAIARRALIGLAMGITAIGIVYSPWGQQSGAHFNPSFTLTFWRLKKIKGEDALFYVVAQFLGAYFGVWLSHALLGPKMLADSHVRYAVTVPGPRGAAVAFLSETLISFLLFIVVLLVSNRKSLARYTPLFVGSMVATYIALESPLSGMSMNPARTLGSAMIPHVWTSLWIYFTAPPLGMLAAAELFVALRDRAPHCAKLHHHNSKRCIFHCAFEHMN